MRIFILVGTLFFCSRNAFMLSTSSWYFLLPYSPNPQINTVLGGWNCTGKNMKIPKWRQHFQRQSSWCKHQEIIFNFSQCSSSLTGNNSKIFHWLGFLLHKHGSFVMTCKNWEIRSNIKIYHSGLYQSWSGLASSTSV